MRDLREVANLIEADRDRRVNFGNSATAPAEEWIVNAEQVLGRLPYSYKYFLRNYGGGEVGGTEILSLYENCLLPDQVIHPGDLVRVARRCHEKKWLERHEICIMKNDFGEIYYLKTDVFSNDECEVWVRRGKHKVFSNETFADFLYDMIEGKI